MAYHNIGVLYEYGKGMATDLDKALDYYRRSERMGDADAAYAIGRVLWGQTEGLPAEERRKKLSEAAYYLNKTADATDSRYVSDSCGYLGLVYIDEDFAERSLPHAEKHLLRGAGMDSTWCMEILIDELYDNPDSPLKDTEKAVVWRERLAQAQRKDE